MPLSLSLGCVYWMLEFTILCVHLICVTIFLLNISFQCLFVCNLDYRWMGEMKSSRRSDASLKNSAQQLTDHNVGTGVFRKKCTLFAVVFFPRVMDFILVLRADNCMENFDSVQGCRKFTANWYFAGKNRHLVKVAKAICSIVWWSNMPLFVWRVYSPSVVAAHRKPSRGNSRHRGSPGLCHGPT